MPQVGLVTQLLYRGRGGTIRETHYNFFITNLHNKLAYYLAYKRKRPCNLLIYKVFIF